jgi:alpha-L-fucosidase
MWKNNLILMVLAGTLQYTACNTLEREQIKDSSPTISAIEEFQDMRFGLFIHFGLYSLPAGVWKNDTIPVGRISEHIMRIFEIPRKDYHQLTMEFNPVNFSPKKIVEVAKAAGMKYIVITSKHHDGFAMFESAYSDYNIKDGTPYAKDLLKQLSEECHKQDMKLGFYYSHSRDWDEYHSLDRYGNNWDWDRNDSARNLQTYLDAKVKPQLTELLTNYGEVFCLWFDTPGYITLQQAEELYDHVKNLQPSCLVNSRLGHKMGDYGVMGDNQIPPGVLSGVWECPATMNHTWGFHQLDHTWKSSEHMIRQLVDLSSKNINYLLNIGPKADGSIPEESIQRLREIGKWISENGEGIYGTEPSPWFQEIDNFRVTTTEGALYLFLLSDEISTINLYNLQNEIESVEHLGSGDKIPFIQSEIEDPEVKIVQFEIPANVKNELCPVLKINIRGEVEVDDVPTQMNSGDVLLQTATAQLFSGTGNLHIAGMDGVIDDNNWPYFSTRNWESTEDYLEWDFNLIEPGVFDVQVINVATLRDLNSYLKIWSSIYTESEDFHRVKVEVEGQKASGPIKTDRTVHSIRSAYRPEFLNTIGRIKINNPGSYKLKLMAEHINEEDHDGIVLYEVRLKKIVQ